MCVQIGLGHTRSSSWVHRVATHHDTRGSIVYAAGADGLDTPPSCVRICRGGGTLFPDSSISASTTGVAAILVSSAAAVGIRANVCVR